MPAVLIPGRSSPPGWANSVAVVWKSRQKESFPRMLGHVWETGSGAAPARPGTAGPVARCPSREARAGAPTGGRGNPVRPCQPAAAWQPLGLPPPHYDRHRTGISISSIDVTYLVSFACLQITCGPAQANEEGRYTLGLEIWNEWARRLIGLHL